MFSISKKVWFALAMYSVVQCVPRKRIKLEVATSAQGLPVSPGRSFLNSIATDIIHYHNLKLTYYKGDYNQFEYTRCLGSCGGFAHFSSSAIYIDHKENSEGVRLDLKLIIFL